MALTDETLWKKNIRKLKETNKTEAYGERS